MSFRFRVFITVACVLVPGLLHAETQHVMPPLPKPQPGYVFSAQETLNYSVDWRVFPAGVATFHVKTQGGIQHVSVEADTVGAVNLLFRVTDKFQSSFNRETGCSAGFSKQIVEGRRHVNSTLTFNYVTGKSLYTEQNLISGIHKRQESAIPPCVTDSLSAIF